MVTKRETRYNSNYPNDIVAIVLVSNETHWYMLHIILTAFIVLHGKYLPVRLLSLTCPV